MYKFLLILYLQLLAVLTVNAQIDSNKLFLESKGTWQYPVSTPRQITDLASNSKYGCLPLMGTQFISAKPSKAFAVTDGRVKSIVFVESYRVIITQFGDFTITYVGLQTTTVKQGDFVYRGQEIGYVGYDLNIDSCEIDIILNKERGEKSIEIPSYQWFSNGP